MQPIPGVRVAFIGNPQVGPVFANTGPEYNTVWRTLSTRAQADQALTLIKALCPNAEAFDSGEGRVAVYVDDGVDKTIKCWCVRGTWRTRGSCR